MSKHTFYEDDTPQMNFRKKPYYFFAKKALVFIPDEPGENSPLLQKKNEPELILYSRDSNRHSALIITLSHYLESYGMDTKKTDLPFGYTINDKELTVTLIGSFFPFIENLSKSKSMSEILVQGIKNALSLSDSDKSTNELSTFSRLQL